MAKGLNKHTPDSEELLKRLNAKDSSGLDDFEKEALEGFDSLDNIEEATRLTNSLNQKIDQKYFQKENKKRGFYYLSLAAGLVLVVGLSVFLFNYLGSSNKELALSNTVTTEQSVNEVAKPTDLSPPPPPTEEPKAEAKEEEKLSQGGKGNDIVVNDGSDKKVTTGTKDNWNSDSRAKSQPDADDGLTSRMVLKEKKPETVNEPAKFAEGKGGDDFKQLEDKSKLQQGPGTVNASPSVVVADQKNKAKDEEAEMDANEKTVSTKSANAPANSNSLAGSTRKESKKASPKKESLEDQKSSGESVATDDVTTVNAPTTVNNNQNVTGGVAQPKRDESGYVHTTEYNSNVYSKPQDYIKTEISKSEMLKTNVKAFKAELTIDDNGKVKEVKFLTVFAPTCTACEKEVRKILLNMPGWKATPSKKAVKETVSYMDQ